MNFIKKETDFGGSRSGVAKESSLSEISAELTDQQLHSPSNLQAQEVHVSVDCLATA
jgi:hypothetical protein